MSRALSWKELRKQVVEDIAEAARESKRSPSTRVFGDRLKALREIQKKLVKAEDMTKSDFAKYLAKERERENRTRGGRWEIFNDYIGFLGTEGIKALGGATGESRATIARPSLFARFKNFFSFQGNITKRFEKAKAEMKPLTVGKILGFYTISVATGGIGGVAIAAALGAGNSGALFQKVGDGTLKVVGALGPIVGSVVGTALGGPGGTVAGGAVGGLASGAALGALKVSDKEASEVMAGIVEGVANDPDVHDAIVNVGVGVATTAVQKGGLKGSDVAAITRDAGKELAEKKAPGTLAKVSGAGIGSPLPSVKTIKKFLKLNDKKAKEVRGLIERADTARDGGADKALEKIDKIIGGSGVEPMEIEGWIDHYYQNIGALYVNMGDTYKMTVLFDTLNRRFLVGSWGDFLESGEKRKTWSGASIENLSFAKVYDGFDEMVAVGSRKKDKKEALADCLRAVKRDGWVFDKSRESDIEYHGKQYTFSHVFNIPITNPPFVLPGGIISRATIGRSWSKQFNAKEFPESHIRELLKARWEDISWGNDAMPHFQKQHKGKWYIAWVNYTRPQDRELEHGFELSVVGAEGGEYEDDVETLLLTVEWPEFLRKLKELGLMSAK